jgi:hypothetical protein
MDHDPLCPRPVLQRDAQALIGLLAILEGEAMASQLHAGLVDHLSRRFASVGLLADGVGGREFRHALNGMNHRIRYALGEYDEPRESMPVP